MNKTRNAFKRIYNGAKGEGFLTGEDVGQRLFEGEIGSRNRPQGVEVQNGNNNVVNDGFASLHGDSPGQVKGSSFRVHG